MNNAHDRLQTASHKLAEALYSQAASGGGAGTETAGGEQASSASAGADGGATGGDDNVIDAEYVDVEDDKK
jgi:molecular chaperone DnaK